MHERDAEHKGDRGGRAQQGQEREEGGGGLTWTSICFLPVGVFVIDAPQASAFENIFFASANLMSNKQQGSQKRWC